MTAATRGYRPAMTQFPQQQSGVPPEDDRTEQKGAAPTDTDPQGVSDAPSPDPSQAPGPLDPGAAHEDEKPTGTESFEGPGGVSNWHDPGQ
jgi:hypothetical protein